MSLSIPGSCINLIMMQFSGECYCGDFEMIAQNGGFKAPETDCAMACPGAPQYICGGAQRLSYALFAL
jgi:hypothetical protein